jgi:hypothetical protein
VLEYFLHISKPGVLRISRKPIQSTVLIALISSRYLLSSPDLNGLIPCISPCPNVVACYTGKDTLRMFLTVKMKKCIMLISDLFKNVPVRTYQNKEDAQLLLPNIVGDDMTIG